MYLFVFTFLVISVIGLHMQVYVLQAAKAFKNQTSMAKTMVIWHKGAEDVAARNAVIGQTPAGNKLVDLSPPAPMLLPIAATDGTYPMLIITNPAADPVPPAPIPGPYPASWTSTLPRGYSYVDYRWYSIAYTPAGSARRIITFVVPPPVSALNPIEQPAIGLTIGELYRQIQRMGVSVASHGTVVPGTLAGGGGKCAGVDVATAENRLCLASGNLVDLPTGNIIPPGAFVLMTQK